MSDNSIALRKLAMADKPSDGEVPKLWKEAKVMIGDTELSYAQSMTLRVAVGSFYAELSDEKFAKDLGPVAGPYRERCLEILRMISKEVNP